MGHLRPVSAHGRNFQGLGWLRNLLINNSSRDLYLLEHTVGNHGLFCRVEECEGEEGEAPVSSSEGL